MNIAIDIRSTLKQKTGIGYYTLNLIQHLAEADKKDNYFLYSQKGIFSRDKKLPKLPAKNFTHLVNRFKTNPAALLKKAHVLHTSSYDLSKPQQCRLVLVVHDVIQKAYPLAHAMKTVKDIDESLKKVLPLADRIIVDSQTTAKDLARFYEVDKAKIRLVYPGVNTDIAAAKIKILSEKELNKKLKVTLPYILYVGTIEPRKNVEGLIRAFGILKKDFKVAHRLVVSGMKGWGCEDIFSLVKDRELEKEIIFTGYVSRSELKSLYTRAEMFVYPSFYEGAGLPILEAFSFGLPVVTSNVSSTAEIAAEAAMLVDPYSYPAIAWAMLRIIKDEHLKKLLKQRALGRVNEFSWSEAARKTMEIFGELDGPR